MTGRCIEEGKQCRTQSPGNNIVTETKSTISRQAVNLFEEPDAGNPQVRFCEGPGPTDTRLDNVAPPGSQAANKENKSQPVVSGETGLGIADKAVNLERCKSSYRQLPESDG